MHQGKIILLLKQVNLSLEQYRRAQMKELDLTPSQGLALAYLFEQNGHPVCATELHEQFGVSKAAISTTLHALRQKGYVEFCGTMDDVRRKPVTLTEKAYTVQRTLDEGLAAQQQALCKDIPPAVMAAMESGLHTMLQNIAGG